VIFRTRRLVSDWLHRRPGPNSLTRLCCREPPKTANCLNEPLAFVCAAGAATGLVYSLKRYYYEEFHLAFPSAHV
jgi:hypothetical protein